MDALLRDRVFVRSEGRCEYCHIPQRYFTERFQVEHIVSQQHRGETHESNLAIACPRCNRHKGPNLSGIDPATEQLTRLFNPRVDVWSEHFRQDSMGEVVGMTAIGRTTVYVLDMNSPRRVELRAAISAIESAEDLPQ